MLYKADILLQTKCWLLTSKPSNNQGNSPRPNLTSMPPTTGTTCAINPCVSAAMSRLPNGNLACTMMLIQMILRRIPTILFSLPLQWYFKPSTPNVHLCLEYMNESNWDFAGPSANGRCQPSPKHFDSNRTHDWNLYNDQEVPKCIQQLVEAT